ncbi:hypothetical protein D9757_005494 [Collybiopsis confluens]|uniref:AN1-type domain-containing protein n=1 Tax=Collybiopsis confluens TaxID=2823264 RepID=A0A8H5HLS7_9AGAR|nr:hypothetical protein D9757_005494 [Collybiopsis confluens]
MSSLPSRATPKLEQDAPLLAIGQQCSQSTCHTIDFLPFKCHHCQESFCQDHFKVEQHSCPKYDESKHNRVAPSCPLCSQPVSIRLGQDPNVAMENHFTKDCSVMTGHVAKKSTPICSQRKCGKTLFLSIRCDKCRKDFCPSHRFPSDHTCTTSAASVQTPVPSKHSQFAFKAKVSTSATLGAIRNTLPASPGVATASQSSSSNSTITMPNPFSKVDSSLLLPPSTHDHNALTVKSKLSNCNNPYAPPPIFSAARAKAERESRRKALRDRAKKGLLSEEEKLRLAAEEAEEAQVEKKGDCLLM